mmetsp:Transcript_98898/g.318947  ORF Transcript_98898/g.318947 Transcript_98898/m.318947 type:complete len:228 (-) Transcript_98898:349-1032(-)
MLASASSSLHPGQGSLSQALLTRYPPIARAHPLSWWTPQPQCCKLTPPSAPQRQRLQSCTAAVVGPDTPSHHPFSQTARTKSQSWTCWSPPLAMQASAAPPQVLPWPRPGRAPAPAPAASARWPAAATATAAAPSLRGPRQHPAPHRPGTAARLGQPGSRGKSFGMPLQLPCSPPMPLTTASWRARQGWMNCLHSRSRPLPRHLRCAAWRTGGAVSSPMRRATAAVA